MNKTEFIERVAEEAGFPRSEAQRYFDAVENVVTSALPVVKPLAQNNEHQ